MPRRANTSSSTCAASASSPGSTRSREETSTTSQPRASYALANSAPVTPEPTTISRSGSSVERVDLGPGEDPLAVGLGVRQLARMGAGGEQDHVGVEGLLAVGGLGDHPVRSVQPAAADRPARRSPAAPARRCRRTGAWPAPSTRWLTAARSTWTTASASPGSLAAPNRRPSSADSLTSVITSAVAIKVLDGHAVGEHRGAAEPVGVDQGDLATELAADQRRLVARRVRRRQSPLGSRWAFFHLACAATEPIASRVCCTPRTGATSTRTRWPSAVRTPR